MKKSSPKSQIARYRQNPELFVDSVLGHNPWETPRKILRDLAKPNARVAVKSCHSSGKCVPADQPVMLADGSRVPAADLVGKSFEVLVPFDTGNKIAEAHAEWNLVEQTMQLTTVSGRRIVRSLNHPLYVAQRHPSGSNRGDLLGWTHISDINPGEFVAVPMNLEGLEFREPILGDSEIKIMAYTLGNMGVHGTGPFMFETSRVCLQDYIKSISSLGDSAKPEPNGFVRGFQFEIEGSVIESKTIHLMRMNDLFQDLTHLKVPEVIFGSPKKQQALFLSRLFSMGGYIDELNRDRISFYSFSERLVRDVQHLLLVQGILSSVAKVDPDLWRVHIDSAWGCIDFLRICGIYGQEERCIIALESLERYTEKHRINRPTNKMPGFPPLPPGMMWEKVEEVNLAGIRATVAIEVPDVYTYIGDFWEHNTHTAADAVLWFVATGGIAITTAPSWPQVEKLLWGEIRRVHERIGHLLGGQLLQVEWRLTSNAYAFGLSTNEGVNFQGHHDKGGGVLVVIDEAPGVHRDIWDAIEGIRAGGDVRIYAPGNPVNTGGPYYDAFHKDKRIWDTYTISAFNTPNFEGVDLPTLLAMSEKELDENVRPYLVTRKWVKEKYYQWGEQDPRWKSRVLGEFPDKTTYDLLSVSWISGAKDRKIERQYQDRYQAGLDVAGAGSDDTVLIIRQGPHILHCSVWSDEDPRDEVLEALKWWAARGMLVAAVDSVGLGHYFIKHLQDNDIVVVPVNASSAPIDDLVWIWNMEPNELPSKRFGNLRAQHYWSLRDIFRNEQITGLDKLPEEAEEELKAIRWIENTKNGKVYIEDKDAIRKRIGRSPDIADALMLAFAEVGISTPQIPLAQGVASGWGFS